MPLVTYAFEGGSNGVAVTTANAGVNTVSQPGSVVFDSAQKETGALGIRCTNTAGTQSLVRTLAAAGATTMSFSFAFRTPTSAVPSGNTLLVQTLRHSSGVAARIFLNPAMELYITDAVQVAALSIRTGLAVGTWYRVSGWVIVGGSGTNVSLNVYPAASNTPLNGSPVTATAWNLGSAAIVGGDSGVAGVTPVVLTTWIDNLQWSDGVSTHLGYHDPNPNQPPTVSAGADQSVTVGSVVNLTANAADPDGSIASTQWSVVSSPAAAPTITGASTVNASFTAAEAGTYVLRVTVTDDDGATTTDDVTVSAYVASTGVRPVALVGTTSWTNQGGAASIPAALADESSATYAQSPATGTTTVTTRLAPLSPGNVVELDVSGYLVGTGTGTATVELVDAGGTVRASWPLVLGSADALYELATTAQQAQAIVGWDALEVRVRWAGAVDRNSLVYGSYEPSTATAGVPEGTSLTTVAQGAALPTSTGNVSPTAPGLWRITVPNTVVSELDMYGSQDIRAANVTVQRCRGRGRPASVLVEGGTYPLIACDNSPTGAAKIIDCTLIPDTTISGVDGIRGDNFYADRNIVADVIDGFHIWGSRPSWVRGNLGTRLAWRTEARPEGTHNDWVQYQGGSGYPTIIGNSFHSGFTPYGSSNLGFIVTDNEGSPVGWTFSDNYLRTKIPDGTRVAIPVNITTNYVTNFIMRNNKIQLGRDNYHVIARTAIRSQVQAEPGNVDLETGQPIIVANGG